MMPSLAWLAVLLGKNPEYIKSREFPAFFKEILMINSRVLKDFPKMQLRPHAGHFDQDGGQNRIDVFCL